MDFDRIESDREEEEGGKKRPGCLWRCAKGALVFAVPLIVALLILPSALSTDRGRGWVLGKINSRIAPATVACTHWSIGWFSPTVIDQLEMKLPRQGIAFRADQATSDSGLSGLLPVGRLNVGKLILRRPILTLFPSEAGKAAETPGAGAPEAVVADFAVSCTVEDGSVCRAPAERAPAEAVLTRINGTIDCPSFWQAFSFRAEAVAGGGRCAVSGSLPSLREWTANRGDAFDKPGTAELTAADVDVTVLRPFLTAWAGDPLLAGGKAKASCALEIKSPSRFSGKGNLEIARFSVQPLNRARSPQGTITARADFVWDEDAIRFKPLAVQSPWLSFKMDGALEKGGGKPFRTGNIRATLTLSLPPFLRDFGSLLGCSKGLSAQSGTVEGAGEILADETACRADVHLTAKHPAFSLNGESICFKRDSTLQIRALFPQDERACPELQAFRLETPFGQVTGSGPLDALTFAGTADLTRFSRDFRRILPACPPMVGSLSAHVGTQRAEGGLTFAAVLKASDLALELSPGRRTVIPAGTLTLKSRMPPGARKSGRAEWQDGSYELKMPGGTVSGGWDRLIPGGSAAAAEVRGFRMDVDLPPEELGGLLGGVIPGEVQGVLRKAAGRLIAHGTAEASGGAAEALLNAAGRDLRLSGNGGLWRIPDFRLEGGVTSGSASGGQMQADLSFSGSGDFTRDGVRLFAEDRLRGKISARIDAAAKKISFPVLDVSCGLGECSVSGSVTGWDATSRLDLRGEWAPDFGAVSRLLRVRGIDEFTCSGRASRKITVRAPLAAGWPAVLEKGEAEGGAFIASVRGLGFSAGPADLTWRLGKGRLALRYLPAVNGGQLNATPSCAFSKQGGAAVTLPPKTRLLNRVALTQEMIDLLLANTNPFFNASRLRGGTVTADVDHFRYAPGEPPEKGIDTAFTLTFHNLELELGPDLGGILTLLRIKRPVYKADTLCVPIAVKNGRIALGRTTLLFNKGKQALTFYGWVGFDGKLAYTVEIPVNGRWMGPLAESSPNGQVVRIPITGTVEHPDFDKRFLKDAAVRLLGGAWGDENGKRLSDFFEQLRRELSR